MRDELRNELVDRIIAKEGEWGQIAPILLPLQLFYLRAHCAVLPGEITDAFAISLCSRLLPKVLGHQAILLVGSLLLHLKVPTRT